MEAIDHEARDRIKNLEVSTREIGSALWGDDVRRDNGLRSDVRRLEERCGENEVNIRTVNENIRHYIDVEREASCHGLAALARYEADQSGDEKEDREVAIAQMNTKAVILAASIPAGMSLLGSVLTMLLMYKLKEG